MIKPKFIVYFTTDTSYRYQAVLIKPRDKYKAAVIALYRQYIYLQIGIGLKGAIYTYAQFIDLVFRLIPLVRSYLQLPLIIGNYRLVIFSPFIDNYNSLGESFDTLFDFLYRRYFLQIAFGLVYLAEQKVRVFLTSLELIRFYRGPEGI